MKIILKSALLAALIYATTTVNLKTSLADTIYYNPVVVVVGPGQAVGSGTLTSAGTPIAIDIYANSTAGQLAPASSAAYASSGGTSMVNSGTATSEGALANNPLVATMAALGQSYTGSAAYVYDAGYGTVSGAAGVTSSTTIPNAVGQVAVTGGVASNAQIVLSQTRTANYSGNNIRAAVGPDIFSLVTSNSNLYTAGTSTGANGSWRNYTTNSQIGSVANTRTVQETYSSGGTVQLFGSSDTGTTVGISAINLSTSTSSLLVQTATASANASPYAFALFNNSGNTNSVSGYNTAYIADDGTATSELAGYAGIEKWTYNGTGWALSYTLTSAGTTGYRGLAGQMDGAGSGDVILFATDASGTLLQQVIDPIGASSNPGNAFTTLATVPTNEAFRGVALAPAAAVPEPGTFALLATGAVGLFYRRRLSRAS